MASGWSIRRVPPELARKLKSASPRNAAAHRLSDVTFTQECDRVHSRSPTDAAETLDGSRSNRRNRRDQRMQNIDVESVPFLSSYFANLAPISTLSSLPSATHLPSSSLSALHWCPSSTSLPPCMDNHRSFTSSRLGGASQQLSDSQANSVSTDETKSSEGEESLSSLPVDREDESSGTFAEDGAESTAQASEGDMPVTAQGTASGTTDEQESSEALHSEGKSAELSSEGATEDQGLSPSASGGVKGGALSSQHQSQQQGLRQGPKQGSHVQAPKPFQVVDLAATQEQARKIAEDKNLVEINKELSSLHARGEWRLSKEVFHAWVAIPGNEPAVITFNFLLNAMFKLSEPVDNLLRVLEKIVAKKLQPNLLTYNAVLRAAFHERNSYVAEQILRRMEEGGDTVAPDADSYNLVVTLCALDRRIAPALSIMQTMLKGGFMPSPSTYNQVLLACAKLRRSRDVIVILRELQIKSLAPIPSTLWELLGAAIEAEDAECCHRVLEMSANRKLDTDKGSLLYSLNLAARAANPQLAEQAWAILMTGASPLPPPPPFHLARIHCYSAAGDLESAFRCVRELEDSLNSSSSRGRGHNKEVETPAAKAEVLSPFTSLRPLMLALSRGVGVLDNAYYKLADMHAGGEVVSLAAINCVIAGCASVHDTERAQQTFEEIGRTFSLQPDVHSYTALMDAYGKERQADKAEALLEEMKERGLLPTAHTYQVLIQGHIINFDARKAHERLENMVAEQARLGVHPPRELLVNLLRRSQRSNYSPGIDYAARLIPQIGYRVHVAAAETRRHAMLMEAMGGTLQDARPGRRQRADGETQGQGQGHGGQQGEPDERFGGERWQQSGSRNWSTPQVDGGW
eukprot:TRINITY_DN18869_c0_g1_i1.p1 TRINITY_DN18869_c0_g1~~TRINITY_DN18869_c0_g1_i1.p1  ORF type:complete len:861 (+),score=167.34 TRINITY_DN18869_c0_g1_i1:118-2700(+)